MPTFYLACMLALIGCFPTRVNWTIQSEPTLFTWFLVVPWLSLIQTPNLVQSTVPRVIMSKLNGACLWMRLGIDNSRPTFHRCLMHILMSMHRRITMGMTAGTRLRMMSMVTGSNNLKTLSKSKLPQWITGHIKKYPGIRLDTWIG